MKGTPLHRSLLIHKIAVQNVGVLEPLGTVSSWESDSSKQDVQAKTRPAVSGWEGRVVLCRLFLPLSFPATVSISRRGIGMYCVYLGTCMYECTCACLSGAPTWAATHVDIYLSICRVYVSVFMYEKETDGRACQKRVGRMHVAASGHAHAPRT